LIVVGHGRPRVDVHGVDRNDLAVVRVAAFGTLAMTLVLAASAAAAQTAVREVSIRSPVRAGGVASLTVAVSPPARCTVAVAPRTAVPAANLSPRRGGRITWSWRVRPNARGGGSAVIVRCGTSGVLRTGFAIIPAERALTLPAAAKAACARAQSRVKSRYGTDLVPLLDRTIAQLRDQYGEFDCAYGSNYYKDGGPLSYYLISVFRGAAPCIYEVSAHVVWVADPPLPGYNGPKDERYTETCKSLRS
jgi:hypothetical protein